MNSSKPLLALLLLGLSATVSAQDNASDAANGQSGEQLAQLFSRLDTNADGVLSLEEFQQMRGAGRGNQSPRGNMSPRGDGERMGQMTPEQREQMRARMQDMTPEQRERMREQMRERRQQGQSDAGHDHGEP
ncbi:MAG: hypothetical protein CMQ34_14555 [Gammaproteobacteria bacterium]|nr:hypothetical protein [Gammaproteobacteria bacterium]|tara:strand:+ start:964 stop:1359 length:396 start_codon:yes stop_codon:yes gene_type:complete